MQYNFKIYYSEDENKWYLIYMLRLLIRTMANPKPSIKFGKTSRPKPIPQNIIVNS